MIKKNKSSYKYNYTSVTFDQISPFFSQYIQALKPYTDPVPPKGTFQKRFSGFCPLRGYPPCPLTFFGPTDCPLRGGGVPPNSAKENSPKKQVF